MPRGTTHTVEGLLLAGGIYPILRTDGGGQWRLDLPRGFRSLIGQRVRVRGTRSGFDMLDGLSTLLGHRFTVAMRS
jgi:Protein of unknown function (DUF5818)